MKKMISLLMVLVLCISLLAGCSKSDTSSESKDNKNQTTDSNTSTQTPIKEEEEGDAEETPETLVFPFSGTPVTISYASTESWTPEYSLADNRAIFQYIEEKTGVKIDWQISPGPDYNTVTSIRIAGGDLPDILAIGAGVNPIDLYENGLTIDHSEYIDKYAPNIKALLEARPDIKAAMTASDGKIYVGAVELREEKANVKGIYYRKDWQNALGIADPVTADDYLEMFKAFYEKDVNKTGQKDVVAFHPKDFTAFGPFGQAFGITLTVDSGPNLGFTLDKDNQVQYEFVKPEMKDFLAYLNRMYEENLLPKEVYGGQQEENTLLSNNRLGAYNNGLGQCNNYDNILLKSGFITEISAEQGYTWMLPPVNKNGERLTPPRQTIGANRFVISAKCENPEIAMMWLDYVWASNEGALLTTMGIEGQSYEIVNGKPEFTDYILNNPDGLGVHPALRTLGAFTPWIAHWTDEAFAAQWAANKKMSDIITAASDKYATGAFPSVLGTPEQSNRVTSIQADLDTYRDEMILKFIMGAESLDNFDKFVETLYDLNLQELLDIKQSQVDAIK
jgi:putative aldouronate transport system substrate-binding protein